VIKQSAALGKNKERGKGEKQKLVLLFEGLLKKKKEKMRGEAGGWPALYDRDREPGGYPGHGLSNVCV
jgi:hypothetical protein